MNLKGILALVIAAHCVPMAAAQDSLEGLLAQFPAQSTEQAAQLGAQLAALGPGAVQTLANTLVPAGGGDDNAARFALSGLAKYAGSRGHEPERAMLSQALCGALLQARNTEVQTFLIGLLEWVGQDEAAPALAACLDNEALIEPASRALSAVGTPKACEALASALAQAQGPSLVSLLNALAGAHCESSIKAVRPFADSQEAQVRHAALYVLAELGDARARQGLDQAAAAPNPAAADVETDLPLRLARQLQADGRARRAGSLAGKLGELDSPVHVQIAALNVLAAARGEKALEEILAAVNSEDHELRCAAIRAAIALNTAKATEVLLEATDTTDTAVRADLVRTLGEMRIAEARAIAEQSLSHPDLQVRLAAIDAVSHLSGQDAFNLLLARRELDGDAVNEETAVLNAALEATRPSAPAAGAADVEGFIPLFNGKDLTGWVGDTAGYAIEEGAIVWKSGRKLYTVDDFADFVLRLEFRLSPGANNGIGIRQAAGTHAATKAMEIQILDDTADKYKDLHPYQFCGSIYGVAPASQGHLKPVGEWNEMEITAKGPQVTVKLNGATVVDANIAAIKAQGTPDGKDHPGLDRTTGRIVLLGHGSDVAYRNIRVKPISAQ